MQHNISYRRGLEIGGEDKINKVIKVISERKQTRKDILKRAAELKEQAAACRRSDPVKSRLLEHRSIELQNEEYKMRKENEHGMTYAQLRKSAASGRCALLLDAIKHKQG